MFIVLPVGMNYRTERLPIVTFTLIGINTLKFRRIRGPCPRKNSKCISRLSKSRLRTSRTSSLP